MISIVMSVHANVFTACEPAGEGAIHCITPDLIIPDEFDNTMNQRRRLLSTSSGFHHRIRRQAQGAINFTTDNSELSFWLGFVFDGIQDYKNLSSNENYTQFAQIGVVRTPVVEELPEVIIFTSGVPLKIKVCEEQVLFKYSKNSN